MRTRLAVVLAVTSVGIGLGYWQIGFVAPAVAGEEAVVAATALVLPAGGEEYKYVGSNKCKKCHLKQYKSWAKTKMAKAFDSLKPGQASEGKQKHKLDPAKDYTKDETCLACHTTGHGKPGGYGSPFRPGGKAVGERGQKMVMRRDKKREGVGCESCHGPGSGYMKVFNEIQESKRKYNVEELYAVGMKKVDATGCTECHNEKSPTFDTSKPFDFEKEKDTDAHESIPLKQREG